MLLDADSVLEIDAQNPTALERLHLQILATGLGKVRPGWPGCHHVLLGAFYITVLSRLQVYSLLANIPPFN